MSTYLNRNSLVDCLFAAVLLRLSSTVLAEENGSDHSTTVPATATDKPAAANDSKLDHGSMDHSKMSHESMDHDQKTKKAD
ncbi:hypothetical protein [Pseudomonas simiae]|uniref:hypothetical protein n=1 Tax=Pseudomonas simiae TaxID=321846 RepID=UPI0027376DC1|nr:hypothetical protein [Pseudomonas simiae]WLI01953.1 hypothetical protein PSH95_04000 [Pseudomonas simiae]